jgi:hypothetical protein
MQKVAVCLEWFPDTVDWFSSSVVEPTVTMPNETW